jgi:anti-anti-sigma factor
MMELDRLSGSAVRVLIDGDLTEDRAGEADRLWDEAARHDASTIILDFSPLVHMNPAGAGILIETCVKAEKEGLSLAAVGLGPRYRQIFALTGLDLGMTVVEDIDRDLPLLGSEGLAALKNVLRPAEGQDAAGWALLEGTLDSSGMPPKAINRNVHGRRPVGPLAGFGPLWEKTYTLPIGQSALKLSEINQIMRDRLPEFQPPQNRFYASPKGILPGEVILIDSDTPGGVVSTGVLVLYGDEESFTLMTPRGHPEAGWVTFTAIAEGERRLMRIRGLASSEDPFYELAFRLAGSKFQERIWTHVLTSMADYLGIPPAVTLAKRKVSGKTRWENTENIWYNAQLRTLPYNVTHLFGLIKR